MFRFVVFVLLLSSSLASRADPGYYVVSVYDNEGPAQHRVPALDRQPARPADADLA
jgi:hypothetical protein